MNPNLQKSEDKLKELVENDSSRKVTVYLPGDNGNPISKSLYLNKTIISKLKPYVEKYDEIKQGSGLHMGGIFPLLALIPAILAGLASTAGVAGGVAAAVNQAKQSQAADKDKELKQAMIDKLGKAGTGSPGTGSGVFLNPHEGKALYSYLKSKGLKMDCLKEGKGIYLNPYESKTKGNGIFIKPY